MQSTTDSGQLGGSSAQGSEYDDYWPENQVEGLTKEEIQNRIENGKGLMPVGSTGLKLRYAFQTQRGYYPEAMDKNNQDAYKVIEHVSGNKNVGYFGVFDGHGKEGDACSYYVRDNVERHLKKNVVGVRLSDPSFDSKFSRVFTDINKETHQRSVCNFDDSQSGTTAVSVYIDGIDLKVANIGDSRCIVAESVNGTLKAIPLTQDQTPYRKDERERCKKSGARIMTMDQLDGLAPIHENWGLNLGQQVDEDGDPPRIWHKTKKYPGTAFTRSIGDRIAETLGVFAEPEINTIRLNENSRFLVIASDGVWEFMTSQAVVDMVAQYDDPLEACKRVVQESYTLWLQYEVRTDDITMIVIHLDGVGNAVKGSVAGAKFTGSGSATESRPVRRNMTKAKKKQIEGFINRNADDDVDYDITKIATPKTDDEKRQIQEAIGNSYLFQHLNSTQRENVYSVMKKQKKKRGDVIIRQGETGDDLYVVGSGVYEVLVHSGDPKEKARAVHRYEHTGMFGELSLMYGKPRAATVRCISSSGENVLWSLDRRSFKQLLRKSSSKDLVSVLRDVDLFKSLKITQIQRLVDVLTEVSYKPKDKIISQGEDGDTFYVIKDGSVRVTINDGSLEGKEVLKYGPGQCFGERALLAGQGKRAANVVAGQKPVTCLQVSRKGFQEVLGDLQELLKKKTLSEQASSAPAIVRGNAYGKLSSQVSKPQLADVNWISRVDESSFGEFGLVFSKQTQAHYSMRRYNKKFVAQYGKGDEIARSLEILKKLTPSCSLPELCMTLTDKCTVNIVTQTPIVATFSDIHGDGMDENSARFYAACLSAALDTLHAMRIVCRGLDSIGLDATGYPQLTDFRLAKDLSQCGGWTSTLCGTSDYFAPEVCQMLNHNESVDLWALGVVIFEMITGDVPFGITQDDSEQAKYAKICDPTNGIRFPAGSVSADCEKFVADLCSLDLTKRLSAASAKNHKWLKKMDWSGLQSRKIPSPSATICSKTFSELKSTARGSNSPFATEYTSKASSADWSAGF